MRRTPLSLAKCIALFAPFICQANLLYPSPFSLFLLTLPLLLTALTSSCPFHSFHSPHVHSSLGFSLSLSLSIHLFPRYECGMRGGGGACDILLNANYQRLLTVFYYLLALPCPLFPSPALSRSCCLSLARFSLFYFQYATHTTLPLFPSLLPEIAAPFFFSKLASITGGKRRKRVEVEKGMWADCVCVFVC